MSACRTCVARSDWDAPDTDGFPPPGWNEDNVALVIAFLAVIGCVMVSMLAAAGR